MVNNVETIAHFDRLFKRLYKKYPGLLDDLGGGFFKVRLRSRSKNTGKSGAFRVITYAVVVTHDEAMVYLVEIYDKSEYDTVDRQTLKKLVKGLGGIE